MKRIIGVAALLATLQAPTAPERDLLLQAETLDSEQIGTVIALTAQSIVGRTFFTYGGFGGGQLTIGDGPRLRYFRQGDRMTEWTGFPAKWCDGSAATGELVLEWQQDESGWQVKALGSDEERPFDAMFELWGQAPGKVEDAGFRYIDGIQVRGLRYPYTPPEGFRFEASEQLIWFDPRTLLPVRYEIRIEGPEAMDYGYFLAFAPGLHLDPQGIEPPPNCIERPRPRK